MTLNAETKNAVRLPTDQPIRLIDDAGHACDRSLTGGFALPDAQTLKLLYRRMVLARRFDLQVTALTRQGRLATYPSALGQEACEIGAAVALQPTRLAVPHLPGQHRAAHPRRRDRSKCSRGSAATGTAATTR